MLFHSQIATAEHAERSWRDTAALLGETEGERDEAIAALRQTLAAAKEVSTRLKQEIALRVAAEERASLAEKLADGLRKSKSQVGQFRRVILLLLPSLLPSVTIRTTLVEFYVFVPN